MSIGPCNFNCASKSVKTCDPYTIRYCLNDSGSFNVCVASLDDCGSIHMIAKTVDEVHGAAAELEKLIRSKQIYGE